MSVRLFMWKLHVITADMFKYVHLGTAITLTHLSTRGAPQWPLVMLNLVYLGKRAVGLHLKDPLVSQTDNVTQCKKIKCINIFVIIMLFHIRWTWCSDPVALGTTVKFFQFAALQNGKWQIYSRHCISSCSVKH